MKQLVVIPHECTICRCELHYMSGFADYSLNSRNYVYIKGKYMCKGCFGKKKKDRLKLK